MTYHDLKKFILSSLNISSTDLNVLSAEFTKLYTTYQTDSINEVTIEPINNTCFKWVKSKQSDHNKILLFFHGGGYTMGSTQDHLELIAQLILQTNVTVLSVDYRLTPSFLFPAPLDDAKGAYLWLLHNGFTPEKIGFSGISAGGLLATQLILSCQQENLPQPKIAVVMSGPGNLDFNAPSIQYNVDRDWISPERLRNIRNYYLPKNVENYQLLLSPITASYTNFPVTLFQAGDYEILLDDSINFYQKLRQQQFNVYLDIVPSLPHCWQLFSRVYAPGRIAIESAARFIKQFF